MDTLHTGPVDDRAAARATAGRPSPRGAGPHVAVGPAVPLSRHTVAALQREAGNHAVAVLARRHGRPSPAPRSGASTVAVYRDAVAPTTDRPELEPYRGESVNKPGQVSAPAKQYAIARDSGVNLRARPDGTLPEIAKLLYGSPVQVHARDTTGAFSFVVARTGTTGWINSQFLALDQPDPAARIHHITEDNLTTILKHEYVDTGRWQLGTGNDYTTLAAAVIAANAGRKGAVVDWDRWSGTGTSTRSSGSSTRG